jgi:hypothetical protein
MEEERRKRDGFKGRGKNSRESHKSSNLLSNLLLVGVDEVSNHYHRFHLHLLLLQVYQQLDLCCTS